MPAMKPGLALILVLALGSAGTVGCGGDEEEVETNEDGTKKKDKAKGAEKAGGHAAKPAAKEPARRVGTLPPRAFRDSDFVEGDTNRDPFRNMLIVVKDTKAPVTQRKVLMPNTPIGSLRLIAIVTGIAQPRAMIVDEKGVGYVATRGDFVGQAEVVTSGGTENLPVSLNWRVDRIRENEVVLAREDPSGPNRPPLTRIIPLHTAEDAEQQLGAATEDT
jgi:hypothetical protein